MTKVLRLALLPSLLSVGVGILLSLFIGTAFAFAGEKKPADGCHKGETRTNLGCVKNPRLIRKVDPVYPPEARKRGVDGSVTLQGTVNEAGTVDEIIVVNVQATDASFNDSLQEAAIAAVKRWQYRPSTIDGKPVPVVIVVLIDFLSSH